MIRLTVYAEVLPLTVEVTRRRFSRVVVLIEALPPVGSTITFGRPGDEIVLQIVRYDIRILAGTNGTMLCAYTKALEVPAGTEARAIAYFEDWEEVK